MSVTRRTLMRVALLAMIAAVAPGALEAQRGPGMRGQDRAELERRIRARFAEMVRERLGLDADQARSLAEVVESFQEERMRLGREDMAVRRRIEALGLERSADEEEARELLERMRSLRLEEARLFEREQERLLEVLTPSQVLAFLALREEMAQRIRRLRGMGPGEDPRPGGLPGIGPLWMP